MSGKDSKISKKGLALLAFSALGVVFGDIGTSVLYAMNEIFFGHHHAEVTQVNVLGAASLAVWALTIIVSFKYVTYVLNADNAGEGGVFALFGLMKDNSRKVAMWLTGGLFLLSAGLLFGDGLITPAISVLSAVEGLKVAAPALQRFVVPITCIILVGLFAIQSQGTGKVGKIFGPVVTVWFITIALLGIRQIWNAPEILQAFNPLMGIQFIINVGLAKSVYIIGSLMLVVTGGEALFADMGHFGKAPIRLAWFALVYPALLINYLGQGAFLLSGQAVQNQNLFYSLVPTSLLYPVIILATMATIIASQALISGVFSLVSQGMSLGLFPRLKVVHTHEHHEGQIYVPFINWALLIGCILLVITFGSSNSLASAYGLAVAGDMLITSLAMIIISKDLWHWSWWKALAIFVPLLVLDFIFLSANSIKFLEGGFVPLGIGLVLYMIMKSWQWGRRAIISSYDERSKLTMQDMVDLNRKHQNYFPRSLLLLSPTFPEQLTDKIPGLMQVFWNRYGQMPRHLIILNISQEKVPFVTEDDRYTINLFENDGEYGTIASIRARYGFMETPEISEVLDYINQHPEIYANENLRDWIIFVGKERLLKPENPKVRESWKFNIFGFLHKNTLPVYEYYGFGDDLRLSSALVPVKVD